MIVRKSIEIGRSLTKEEREEIRALKGRQIFFDEDCPEITEEQLKKFRRVNPRRKPADKSA